MRACRNYNFRHGRRSRNLRYRKKRSHRARQKGWIPPSLQSRVDNIDSLTRRLRRWAPIKGMAMELVRFDLQKMENPEIKGVEYQKGTLHGYEVWEYLLEKWGRKCVYCGAEHVPLGKEHIVCKARGGTDRITNITVSCRACNEKKDDQLVEDFLAHDPERLEKILAQAKRPLKDAAAVHTTRWKVLETLKAYGLPVETSSGGRTKWNRTRLGIHKTHALDAVCVGEVEAVHDWQRPTLVIKAMVQGSYQRTRVNEAGFPVGYLPRQKTVKGFQTGDMVRAEVREGKKKGTYVGRVAVRRSGYFNIQTKRGTVEGISYTCCRIVSRSDGYNYSFSEGALLST